SLPGFRTYVQTGIVLQVNSNPTIDPVLSVGQVSETVEVQADAALVETRNTGVGTVMDNQRVLELPLNGRQVTELIFLAGMATPGVGSNGVRNYPTVVVSVAGGQGNGVTYLLDGANHNDPYNSLNFPLPPRCSTGVQAGDQWNAGAVRLSFGSDGECGHEVRHQ